MGLEVNIIKTGINTLSRCATAGVKDGAKVVQLAKNSPLRELGFSEMTHSADGWSLRGKNISEWFSSSEKEKLQNFIREHTTGTTVQKTANETIVQYGNLNGRKLPCNDGLFGFEKRNGLVTLNTKIGDIAWGKIESCEKKSAIKNFLAQLRLSAKIKPTQKWTIQELDKYLCEDFSEEIIKPVHEYIEGKLSKTELLEFIKKFRRNTTFKPFNAENEALLQTTNITIPACYVPKEILDNLNINSVMRRTPLYGIYEWAGMGDKKAEALLKEFRKTLNISPDKRTSIYRCVGKEEVNKILAGKRLFQYDYGNYKYHDVTTNPYLHFGGQDYRVKFNIKASEQTMPNTIAINKPEQEYYHWNHNGNGYTIEDVSSISNIENNAIVYESDDEILSNFIDGYISKYESNSNIIRKYLGCIIKGKIS